MQMQLPSALVLARVLQIIGFYCIFLQSVSAQGFGTVFGRVTDALTGEAVSNATVRVGGLNVRTNANGQYIIRNISPTFRANFSARGSRFTTFPNIVGFFGIPSDGILNILECTAVNYVPYSNNEITIQPCKRTEINIALTRDLLPGALRIILTWKRKPSDLDSYLYTPKIGNVAPTFVNYFRKGISSVAPFATLDRDALDGFGPETITIHKFFPGTYTYSIFNNSANFSFSDYNFTGPLAGSGAVVQIYNDKGLLRTITVPEQTSTTSSIAQWWNVCTIDGSTGSISVINKVTNQSTAATFLAGATGNLVNSSSLNIDKSGAQLQSVTTAVFNWDFGGGTKRNINEDVANPGYAIYDSAPTYDISLYASNDLFRSRTRITKQCSFLM